MKKTIKSAALISLLMLLFVQAACAEPSEILQGIFDALTAKDSSYSQTKVLYAEYMPEAKFEEELTDDSIIITISGIEGMDGTRTFVQDGDYLKTTLASGDFYGAMLATEIMHAVGAYYEMNTRLLTGYINGLDTNGLENKYFISTPDEKGENIEISIYIAKAYDMKELDEIVLNEATLSFAPLTRDYNSMAAAAGKIRMIANGTTDFVTILVGEYGELDDLAYQSIINIVKALKPQGWETFETDYPKLADAELPYCTVTLNPDESVVSDIIYDDHECMSFALLRFGTDPAW